MGMGWYLGSSSVHFVIDLYQMPKPFRSFSFKKKTKKALVSSFVWYLGLQISSEVNCFGKYLIQDPPYRCLTSCYCYINSGEINIQQHYKLS